MKIKMKKLVTNIFSIILILNSVHIFSAGQLSQDQIKWEWITAIYFDNLEKAKALIEYIDLPSINSAFIGAAKFEYADLVKFISTVPKINVNAQNDNGDTALMVARNPEIIKILLAIPGIDVNVQNNKTGDTALIVAQDPEIIKMLLAVPGININAQNKSGETALIRASLDENKYKVEQLLQRPDIKVNIQDKSGDTALMRAAFRRNIDIMNELLKNKADIHIKNRFGQDALLRVASSAFWIGDKKYEDVFKLLLNAGANPDSVDNEGETALDLVRSKNRERYKKIIDEYHKKEELIQAAKMPESQFEKASQIIKTLFYDGDVNINEPDKYGNTALIYAAGNNNERLVGLLISLGANPKLKNKHNQTAADIAEIAGHSKLATYLKLRAI